MPDPAHCPPCCGGSTTAPCGPCIGGTGPKKVTVTFSGWAEHSPPSCSAPAHDDCTSRNASFLVTGTSCTNYDGTYVPPSGSCDGNGDITMLISQYDANHVKISVAFGEAFGATLGWDLIIDCTSTGGKLDCSTGSYTLPYTSTAYGFCDASGSSCSVSW